MIYVKILKRSGGEEIYTATRTHHDEANGRMVIYSGDKSTTIDLLSGDAVYVMTQTGQTMSSHRPR